MGTRLRLQRPTTTDGPSLVLGTGLVRTIQILELERDVDVCGSHDIRMINNKFATSANTLKEDVSFDKEYSTVYELAKSGRSLSSKK